MNVSPLGEINMDQVRYVQPEVGAFRLVENDVLFTNTSSTTWVGKSALVRRPGEWGFSNHMTRLRVGTGMEPEFVARQLHYLCLCGYFAFHCKKHVNQSSIAGRQLADSVPFRCPPREEQGRIISKLRRLLKEERNVRTTLEALPALVQECRAAVLNAACCGRLVPTEAEVARRERREYEHASVLLEGILGQRRAKWEANQIAKMRALGSESYNDRWRDEYSPPQPADTLHGSRLPAGWCIATAEQLTDASKPISYGVIKLGNEVENGVPVLRSSNVRSLMLELNEVKRIAPEVAQAYERTFLKGNEVLVSVRGTLGGVCAVDARFKGYNVSREIAVLSLVEPKLAYAIAAFIASKRLQEWLSRHVTGAAQQGVNIADLRRLPIPLAPLGEMRRIAAEVERRLSALRLIEQEVRSAIERTIYLRTALFHRALSGKLVHQRQADEPATNLLSRIRAERQARAAEAKRRTPRRKERMRKLSPEVVKEAIQRIRKDRFTFTELCSALRADYEPLKAIVFELLAEAKPCVKQVFDTQAREIRLRRIKP